jgi:hypothetical protein
MFGQMNKEDKENLLRNHCKNYIKSNTKFIDKIKEINNDIKQYKKTKNFKEI